MADDDDAKDKDENAIEFFDDTIWDGGPPVPPDPDMVVQDLSCQGTVAMALQEALDEWLQLDSMKALQNKYNFQFDCKTVMHAFGESVVQQQHSQYDAQWDHHDAMKRQQQKPPMRQAQADYSSAGHYMNNATGTAVTNGSSDDSETIVAPAAMLRGRINHYNRFGTKWRIVVHDVDIRPRRPVNAQQLRQMKRDRNMSLWSIMSSSSSSSVAEAAAVSSSHLPNANYTTEEGEEAGSIKIPRLQLLLYNDIE
jgi:hypothetical protein